MAHQFSAHAFTPEVRRLQEERGSRTMYSRLESGEDSNAVLSSLEADFISKRDSFYLATVSETGWPYVQHRGGPRGFLHVLDERSLAFADFRGNRQYISAGNLRSNDRVALILMDYPNRKRLKILGYAKAVTDSPELLAALEHDDYRARVEQAFIIRIAAFDWNCPQHIQPRYTLDEMEILTHTP